MPLYRPDLPFNRGETFTAGDTLIVNQLGSMSSISALFGQTNPAANTDIKNAGVGGPGQLPTANLPYYPIGGLAGIVAADTDRFAIGLGGSMTLRVMQYIPASGSLYLVLDGHALAVSNAVGWQQYVVTGKQGTQGAISCLPDPAYFMGKSSPSYVKPYDLFWVVEEGPAIGIVGSGGLAASLPVMSKNDGTLVAATAGNMVIGTADGNNGNAVSTTQYGYGQYTVPTVNTPALGTVNTTTGAVTAATYPAVWANAFAPVPNGVTQNPFTGGASTGNYMPSGATYNASNLVLAYVRPFMQASET